MLSVANARQQLANLARGFLAIGVAIVFLMLTVSVPVMATDTTVGVSVRDGLPTMLTVTTAIDGAVVVSPTVIIEGAVHNISQIVVYVDSTYNTSIPLASGASTYIVAFGVTPGTHEVRVVGLDPYTNTEVSQTIQFAYEPTGKAVPGVSAEGTPEETVVDNYVRETIDAAITTGEDARQQVQQASSSGLFSGLSDAMFTAFKSIDMVSVTDGTGVNTMVGRFTLVNAGLAATIFPWTTYAAIQKLRFLPRLAAPSMMATIPTRIVGIALLIAPFIFLS